MPSPDLSLFCQVVCHSHELNADAFQDLQGTESVVKVEDITASTFFLAMRRHDVTEN